MKIAMLGAQGVAAAELATGLQARGHQVVIYSRARFAYALCAAVHVAWMTRPDVAVFFAAAVSPLCLITRAASIPTVIHIESGGRWLARHGAPHFANRAITGPLPSSSADTERFEQLLEAVRVAGGPGRLPDYLLDLDP